MTLTNAIERLKRVNVQVNQIETLLGKSVLLGTPTHLEIDLLSKCNLRCIMCHQSKISMGDFKLDSDQIDVLIDQLPVLETVMIAGLGEPLLYKRIESFLPYFSRYHCKSHLYTNGLLIDKRLNALSHIDRISVSFDGDNKKTFEELRVRSDFGKILSNIEMLRSRCPDICIVTSTVVSRRNVNEILGIVQHASNLGMNEVHLSPVDHTPQLSLREKDYSIFTQQLEAANELSELTKVKIFNSVRRDHFYQYHNSVITAEDKIRVIDKIKPRVDSRKENAREDPVPMLKKASQLLQHLSAEQELEEVQRRTAILEKHRAMLKKEIKNEPEKLKIPSCTAPWKYTFACSTGQARLCPYADINVGKVEDVLGGSYNSPLLQDIRRSLVNNKPILSLCSDCSDYHREF